MSTDSSLDIAALREWMSNHVEGFTGPIAVERFQGGQSNPTYKLITPGRSYVMRTKPAAATMLLPSAHAIDREYRLMAALAASDVPVARVYGLCEDEGVIGRAFYIMEFVEGRVLWDPSLPGMEPAQRAEIYDEMGRALAALHCLDYRALGLANYGRPGNYFERQIARWCKQYRLSTTEPIPAMEALIEWLPAKIPRDAEQQVCITHGDYRLDNLMFHPTEPRVVAVLDWELSTLGHPMADLGYLCMGWHIAPADFRGIGGLDLAALGIPDEQAYRRRYAQRTGRTDDGNWSFYLAFSLFRIAAILQAVMKRATLGTAASAQALDAGRGASTMAALAWQFAQRG